MLRNACAACHAARERSSRVDAHVAGDALKVEARSMVLVSTGATRCHNLGSPIRTGVSDVAAVINDCDRMLEFARVYLLLVSNAVFQHKWVYTATWYSLSDYIDRCALSSLKDFVMVRQFI